MESPESPIAPSLFQHPRSLLSSAERDADFAPEAAGPSKPCSYTTTVEVIADSPTAIASPSTSARTSASYVTDRADPNCSEPRLSARSHFESPMDDVRFRDGELRSDKSIWVEPAFDYTPNRGDELKLKRGSTIKVIRCNEDEEGWWYGETVDGKKGYFPQSYVKLAERKPIEINMDDLKVTGTLGTGGFGIVKSAMYRGREVAVKIPNSKFSRDKIAELVKEEASILQMIHHRNFIRLFGIVIGERPALVLELCQDSLSKISQRSRGAWISAQTIAFWGAQIARGMSYLHQLNVLHRDLKAANILVKEKVCESCLKYSIGPDEHVPYILDDGFCKECGGAGLRRLTLKIADLGLSKRIQFSNCINRISVMGTVSYLAPEVVVRKLCSKAMDVWSFGLILWEVLTGTTPFAGMCPSIAILQIGHYRKQEIPSSCPVELKEIIESCWCRDPEDRPTFKLLATQLQTLSETCEAPDFSRRNFMKEAQTLLKNMKEKADELQRRENEITIRELGRILVQAMSLEPPKVKPTPPKRKPFLTTSDISKPYDYKEGLSLTKNIHMDLSNNDDECDRCAQVESRRASDFPSSPHKENIEVRCRKFSEPPHVPMQGFLTIPRRSKNEDLPKKLSNDVDKLMNEMDAEFPSTRELLNPLYKSTPNLLRSHMPVYRDSSPQLHRCNATRRIMKEPPRRTDPDCNFSGGRVSDYETLKEQGSRFTSLDHLATPRRIPPSGVNIYGSRPNVRVTLANGNRYHLKTGRDSDWNFLNFFKFYKEKSPCKFSSHLHFFLLVRGIMYSTFFTGNHSFGKSAKYGACEGHEGASAEFH
ncbi:hypothetical protein AB6A40_004915 [Gnathostoma spinigerum]|uniref:mitogen-activated protein kinase kinase kinase n=1 Tax=Gnathostoma spinigerum TaxID=75299 RepID=A0ABD6ELB3_9BILA